MYCNFCIITALLTRIHKQPVIWFLYFFSILSSLAWSPGWEHCIVFLNKTHNSYCLFLGSYADFTSTSELLFALAFLPWIDFQENERTGDAHFHTNSFAQRLVLPQRPKSTIHPWAAPRAFDCFCFLNRQRESLKNIVINMLLFIFESWRLIKGLGSLLLVVFVVYFFFSQDSVLSQARLKKCNLITLFEKKLILPCRCFVMIPCSTGSSPHRYCSPVYTLLPIG